MQQQEPDRIPIEANDDVVRVRVKVRDAAVRAGFGHTDQVRLVTAASELARNIRLYAERGLVEILPVKKGNRRGLRIKFEDRGPGIPNIKLAMTDGYTTSRGLGKGLPGSRRLVDDFEIESVPGEGTTIKITKWL
jgi:serine/threonine-protein kinase RsbT